MKATRNESCYVFVAFFMRVFALLRCSKKKRPYKKNISIVLHFFFLLFFAGTLSLIMPGSPLAKEDVVKKDSDKDGKIDQIAHFDKRGKIIKLEIDSNSDEIMDRFQYYEQEEVKGVERDTNYDQKIDAWDYFEAGKRTRHERASTETGQVNQIIKFDAEERPLKIQKDTTGDGLFDSIYHFKEGSISHSTKDMDGDGKVNVWQTYRDDKLLERRVDENGDGRL